MVYSKVPKSLEVFWIPWASSGRKPPQFQKAAIPKYQRSEIPKSLDIFNII